MKSSGVPLITPEKSLVVVSTDLLVLVSSVVAVLKSPEEPLPEELEEPADEVLALEVEEPAVHRFNGIVGFVECLEGLGILWCRRATSNHHNDGDSSYGDRPLRPNS